jgi:hypothetical protein
MKRVRRARLGSGDAFYFNWTLRLTFTAVRWPR